MNLVPRPSLLPAHSGRSWAQEEGRQQNKLKYVLQNILRKQFFTRYCELFSVLHFSPIFLIVVFISFKYWCSFHRPGTFHGVAVWMDFHLTEKLTITTGLQQVGRLNIN